MGANNDEMSAGTRRGKHYALGARVGVSEYPLSVSQLPAHAHAVSHTVSGNTASGNAKYYRSVDPNHASTRAGTLAES